MVCLSCSIVGLPGWRVTMMAPARSSASSASPAKRTSNRQVELALTDVAGGNRDLAALRLEHVVITLGANMPRPRPF
jgi:hypothetical protein